MPFYCTNCEINWHSLASTEEPGDEVYEYCPECNTDIHLVETTEEEKAYVKCMLSGRLIDAKTGKSIHPVSPPIQGFNFKEYKPDILTKQRKEEEYQERQRRAVDAYIKSGSVDEFIKHHAQDNRDIKDVE